MEIDQIPIEWMDPAPYRPRKDLQKSDPAFKQLKQSLDCFGNVIPLVWNQETGHLISGHQRLKILKEQGKEEVICSILDVDITQEKVLSLALNKISGQWEIKKLKHLLYDLMTKVDHRLMGFESDELIDLFIKNEIPDFKPVPEEGQPRLDEYSESKQTECPHCGKPISP